MKKILLLFILFFVCCLSCSTKDEMSTSLKPQQNLIVLKYKNSAFFINENKTEGFFIQYNNAENVDLKNISAVFYDKIKGITLTRLNGTKNEILFDKNVFGFGKFKGINSKSLINSDLQKRNLTQYPVYVEDTGLDDGDISAIKCGCINKNSTKKPNNCQHGGEGSSQCGVSEGLGVYNIQCESTCESTHYSCCTTDDKFHYDK